MLSRLLVCAPLGCEMRALRNGLDGNAVLTRTGYGPRRSARSVARLAGADFDALAIAGLAGGLGELVASGDIVVSTEIRGSGAVVRCPSAPLVAGELRRSGLIVHCGPICSENHVVTGGERSALARSGALAVDMESAQLVALSGQRSVISVRVVVDTDRDPLVDPRSATRLSRALRNLRGVAPTLNRWGRSVCARRAELRDASESLEGAARSLDRVRWRFPLLRGPDTSDIRRATTTRQTALQDVADRADLVLVLGSSNSPHSWRLVEMARRYGTRAYLVSEVGEVELAWLRDARTVGVTADAPAPPELVDQLVVALRGLGPLEVIEHRTTKENMQFGLPKEVSG